MFKHAVTVILLPASLVLGVAVTWFASSLFLFMVFCPFPCAVFWSGCSLYLFPFLFLLHAWVLQSLFLHQGWHSDSWNSSPVCNTSVGQNCQKIQKLKVYQCLCIRGVEVYCLLKILFTLIPCCNWATHIWHNRRLIY